MTHDRRCVCDACWPARLGDMRALIVADARRRGAELLARAARPVARPRRAKVSARSPRKALRRHLAATKLPPELVDLVMPAEPARIDSGRPVRSRAPRVPSARVEPIAPVVATRLADPGPSRLPPSGPPPELRDVAAQAVALRPRREVLEERAAIVVRTKQPRRVIEGAKVVIGPPAPVDDSPLPCVPVDLAAIGGSSFDIGRAWGGGARWATSEPCNSNQPRRAA